MLIFIAVSLSLCFLVQTDSSLQNLLISSLVVYIGIFFVVTSILGAFFKKMPTYISHDMFATSTLLVWFAYWKPVFNDDSPIFFFYPLYFAFTASFMTLYLIGQKHKIDNETLAYMQAFAKKSMIQPWLVMLGVLVSLGLQQNYTLYPIMMTLLMIRFVLTIYLERK
ncbi:MAG: hypothetical protein ACXW0Q_07980 [Methylovulum sp.]